MFLHRQTSKSRRLPLSFASLLIVAHVEAAQAQQATYDAVLDCARRSTDPARAECISDFARRIGQPSGFSARVPGSDWRLAVTRPDFEDRAAIGAYVTAEGYGSEELWVVCGEHGIVVFAALPGADAGRINVDVEYRIDWGEARTTHWSVYGDSVGLWVPRRAANLLDRLAGAARLAVRIIPVGRRPITVAFPVRDLARAIAPARAACGG